MRRIETRKLYRHFKGKLYFVHDIATNSENSQPYVVYQAMYGDYRMYIRPLDMFASEIDPNREDNVTKQFYRFEKFGD